MIDSSLSNPTELTLAISADVQSSAWQNQSGATEASRWNAYLNQLCLQTLLPWFREEQDSQARPWPHPSALASFWEVVNGVAIAALGARLVLMPTEAVDLDELRVPQEWIDLPEWAADYYLAVQVNPDEQLLRVWGYSTHQQLKAAEYDAGSRTYVLDGDELIADINALWVARRLCPNEPTRAALTPLPSLSATQANNLLQRLGDPAVLVPRLAVPFTTWGALLKHGGWRQQLADRRRGLPEQYSVLQWLQTGVSRLAQQSGWQRVDFQPSLASARGAASQLIPALVRQLAIANQSYQLRIFPLSNLDSSAWRIELRSLAPGGRIPAGFKLRLLSEALEPFPGNEVTATTAVDQLGLEVALAPGEGLVWEVEPTPANYDREILRF
ncbi:MAG: DUF1822 family protein [Cyanophyceae cyanobacterium]